VDSTYIRVAVADDHPVIRLGIAAKISDVLRFRLVGVASGSSELVSLLDAEPCDVLVTDYAMPGGEFGDGLELLTLLQERYRGMAIVVMTGVDRPAVVKAMLGRGIESIVSKSDDMSHLVLAVHAAFAKRGYLSPSVVPLAESTSSASSAALSPRELEVLSFYLGGATINEIAAHLMRRKQTVSTQKVRGMERLGLEGDADLFKHARELGLLPRTIPKGSGG
jgi:two-component system, NarL family, captular synthesis response regulator RcsB